MPENVVIREADFNRDFSALRHIRETVFVREQSVPLELEWDAYDQEACHLLAWVGDQAVATARLLRDGKIGRMAVLPEWRHQGIGTALLRRLLDRAAERGLTHVWLSAQVKAIPFYQRLGFRVRGPVYEDAGIAHQDMTRPLPTATA
ncbi:MAG: GNAT family N-acetyltransferase [Gammaproteobacteria bacterium]